MQPEEACLRDLTAKVAGAARSGQPLRIVGAGTKGFYGRTPSGRPLYVGDYRGILAYEPAELVITARAGTPLGEVEAALAERGQCLPFEPPHFGAGATVGGTVACGFSGPRRPFAGALRDFLLGTRLINGRGEVLRFGGRVMKNVAGYDVSRLMAGALGTLGVLLEVTFKVLPAAPAQLTLRQEATLTEALLRMNRYAGRPWPLSALAWAQGLLWIRLSGAPGAIAAARRALGGEEVPQGEEFWRGLREHTLPFFTSAGTLWRLSVPPAAPMPELEGEWLLDWGGAQRWLKSARAQATIRAAAQALGGHATLFRGGDRDGEVFTPLGPVEAALHRRLKECFDPCRILNIGRMYPEW